MPVQGVVHYHSQTPPRPFILTSVQTKHMTHSFAVQPIRWNNFDDVACVWANDINDAFRIGQKSFEQGGFDEPCMIWMVPEQGEPVRWCRCDENTNAIADMVFGRL